MIPKKIHYCWFGGNPLPADAQACIESWKKYCPDYEIIEWNEKNSDLTSIPYVREAYRNKSWAFVSDYIRLKALYTQGGIYMDTDVEVLKNLDAFLSSAGFFGFETDTEISTGIMAAEPGNSFIYELLCEYDTIHFQQTDGTLDMTTNVARVTRAAVRHGLKPDNTRQSFDGIDIYPKDWFCPKNNRSLEIRLTQNSHTIHHFAGSWVVSRKKRLYRRIKTFLGKHFGITLVNRIIQLREHLGLSK